MSLDHKGNLAKLACSLCFPQHFSQTPPPPPKKKKTKKQKKKKRLKELWKGKPMLEFSETNGQSNPYGDVLPHLR